MGTEVKEIVKKNKTGKAEVRVLKDVVKVLYADEDGFVREFPIEDVEGVKYSAKDVFVSLNKDETIVRSIRPFAGTFAVRLKGFFAMPDEPPATFVEQSRKVEFIDKTSGQKKSFVAPERTIFTALLEVQAPAELYDGAIYPYRVPYAVDRDQATGNFMVAGSPRNCQQMKDFLEKFGFDFNEDSLPHSSNILPQLEKVLLERDMSAFGIVQNGYINAIERIPLGFEVPKKKKKPGRKPKKTGAYEINVVPNVD
jgi:hypothetical protein